MSKPETKSETKTAESTTTPFPALPGAELWSNLMREQLARLQSWSDELVKLEATAFERMKATAGDASRAMNDSVGYLATLSAEWRKQALDAGKRAIEMTGIRG